MEFDLSKPQKLLKDSAREFLSRNCKSKRVRELMTTDTANDDELWQAMADQGWTGLLIPEEYGGMGAELLDLAVVCEEMGNACLPGAFQATLFSTALIDRAASPTQKAQYLEAIASGSLKASVAQLEETADWDPDAINLKAVRDNGRMLVSGRKLFVPDAATADLLICLAASDLGGGESPMILPVSKGADGVEIKSMPSMDETRKVYEVQFNNVSVNGSDVFGADGNARGALVQATQVATVALCAEMVGGMQWILDTTVEYAKTRHQFGRPIGSFQAVQHQCADMLLMTESARSATYYAAWAVTEGVANAGTAVSIAKAYCSDAFREVGNRGVQVHGGIGFTWEHDLQLYYKRSKAAETMFGDATFHRERIARAVVDSH
jgi:alkylation response protein AidB-like acyl-CoA dehydrogenase